MNYSGRTVIMIIIRLALLAVLTAPMFSKADPLIKTNNLWLRADIETLANIGVINTPISTFPLTWGPILNELKSVKLYEVHPEYQATFLRVLRTGIQETGSRIQSEIKFSYQSEDSLLRSFGDSARSEHEVSLRTSGLNSQFAWNLEVTRHLEKDSEGKQTRFDGSYIAAVLGNWVLSAGELEKFWGPGVQQSLILSNNAKPIPAINIQRNNKTPFESPWLSWIGPWSFDAFVGQLDDTRAIEQAKLIGMSVSFKPHQTLEIGLRRTAQWGGVDRPENFDSFVDMMIGLDNCDEGDLSCEDNSQEPGNQLAAIDLNWRNDLWIPANVYVQMVGEDEAGYFPSKKSFLYGLSLSSHWLENPLWFNIESLDTTVDGDGNIGDVNFTGYNVLYEHYIYRTGYRYYGQSLGASIDNDSSLLGLNVMYQSTEGSKLRLAIRDLELNRDGKDVAAPGGHSLSADKIEFVETMLEWQYQSKHIGIFTLLFLNRDKEVSLNSIVFDKNSFKASWTLPL